MPSRTSIAGPYGPRASTGGGGRSDLPPQAFGGGGGGRGDGDEQPSPAERLRRYRLGLYFAIAFTAMIFVSLTTLFAALRTSGRFDPMSGHYVSNWATLELPFRLLMWNTLLIAASSLCIEIARRKAAWECIVVPASRIPGLRAEPRLSRLWAAITVGLGAAFLYGQWRAWREIAGFVPVLRAVAARSFVYVLTGTHAVHFFSAIVVLGYGLLAPRPRACFDTWRITIDLTSLYWHFMAIMWLYVLAVLWTLR